MKDRQKKLLRFLLTNQSSLQIEDLAKTFAIGRRTVTRDLDVIERWLSLKGVLLERKPGKGIQVLAFGKNPSSILESLSVPNSYIESLSPHIRKKLILLYIIFNNREIKISEIAHAFFISDTSVWNDLNQIESDTEKLEITLERMKGVGIHLTGNERVIRLLFLRILSQIFSSRTIIPYLFGLKEDSTYSLEVNQFRILMDRIKFPDNSRSTLRIIEETSEKLGYHFTMSGESLLYFYLQLLCHRVKSGAMINKDKLPDSPKRFKEASQSLLSVLTGRILSGSLPENEMKFLGLFLQSLEMGDVSPEHIHEYQEIISPEISAFTRDLISEFGNLDQEMHYMNEKLNKMLDLAAATLIIRLKYNIPGWHGDWGNVLSEKWNKETKENILRSLLEKHFNLIADSKDLEYLLMYFQALKLGSNLVPDKKIRCMVSCFEGIGLASYLQSILKREIKELEVVEATAVNKINKNYISSHNIDLVLSTFPITNIQTPVILISLPLNKENLKRDVTTALETIRTSENSESKEEETPNDAEKLTFESLWDFIYRFGFLEYHDIGSLDNIIRTLSMHITDDPFKSDILFADFMKREALGSLYFEEYGIRVLHCKSSTVESPSAGIILNENEEYKNIIYLVSPDPCPDAVRQMLSTITVSFLENRSFRDSVMKGDRRGVHKNLMDIYKEFI